VTEIECDMALMRLDSALREAVKNPSSLARQDAA
jgi:hypothetical protein